MTNDSAKPIKQPDSDRPEPINDARLKALEELAAMDQELELKYGIVGNPMIKAQPCKAAKTDTTQPRNGTPAEGSKPREGTEPVAWALIATEGAIAGDVLAVTTTRELAFRKFVDSHQPCRIVPLIVAPPQDSAAMSPASAGSVADIIDRLCAAVQEDEPPRRALLVSAAAEIERLRFAIRRLAEQDATLSVCDGAVTVTIDATLTDEEREAVETAMNAYGSDNANPECAAIEATLWGLLERTQ